MADVDRMRPELQSGARIVIVGGGYIGLEVAASCRELGLDVTVLEMAGRVMNRVVCPEISTFYETEHARHGVRIVCNARVSALTGDSNGRVRYVVCEDGSEYPADIVLVAVGVGPVDDLASAAGLECSNGIVVDEYCRTSDPNIFAAGDCTNHPSLHYDRRVRLESVDNAFEQATSAAVNMTGPPAVHDKIPWFWSDQFDLKLIIIGLCGGHDSAVLRGSVAARSFTMCYLRNGELIAADTVNSPKDQMAARKLIAARARPNTDKLADANVPLQQCV
jgi:3-phenylpropionate/trans-cinnamate dioxygenase ferredoxin reductase subunit